MVFAPISRSLLLALIASVGLVGARTARAEIVTPAEHALLVDYASGEVLFCKACEVPMPPSSMSKLMTVELVFQRLKDGRLKPEDTFHVSETAWRQGQKDNESKMWVAINSDVSIDDLLKGIIVQSGGDACVVVAESIAGSESAFADHAECARQGARPHAVAFRQFQRASRSRPIHVGGGSGASSPRMSFAPIPTITIISRFRISPGARSASPTATRWSTRISASTD